jgi:hypothetical protein
MANLDRGAYEADRLHEFEVDESGEDTERSRLPLLVMIALVVLAAFGGVVWLAYSQGVERGRADAPRIIVAQSRPTPTKAAPAPSPYAGLNIYQSQAPASSETDNAESVPPPPTPLAANHFANSPPSLRPSAAATQESPAKDQAAPASPSVPATTGHRIAQQTPATSADNTALPPPEKSAVASAPILNSSPVVAGKGVLLQVGSYKSDSEALQSWNAFKVRHGIAAAYQPDVQRVDLGTKGIWYRLRFGAFTDRESAVAICEKLKAQGAGCFVAR